MIGLKNSYEIAYNGTENECRFELYADTTADLQGLTHIDGIKIQMGSECTDIATGDKYLLNGSGAWILQPSDRAFSNVYTKSDIDDMITEINGIIAYYHTTLISDTGEIAFYSPGGNVGTWKIYGNGQQTGTPTPAAPITPDFCGTLDGEDWTIPITCAGQTVPVYLGQTQTVRKIRKLVLDGTEALYPYTYQGTNGCYGGLLDQTYHSAQGICSHYPAGNVGAANTLWIGASNTSIYFVGILDALSMSTVADFKAWLAAQYAAGHPVTVWYVLATPETAIVNEPLAKIGDYADELHSEDAGVTIPTVKGRNTLTVDTELPPSLIEISGGITHE